MDPLCNHYSPLTPQQEGQDSNRREMADSRDSLPSPGLLKSWSLINAGFILHIKQSLQPCHPRGWERVLCVTHTSHALPQCHLLPQLLCSGWGAGAWTTVPVTQPLHLRHQILILFCFQPKSLVGASPEWHLSGSRTNANNPSQQRAGQRGQTERVGTPS